MSQLDNGTSPFIIAFIVLRARARSCGSDTKGPFTVNKEILEIRFRYEIFLSSSEHMYYVADSVHCLWCFKYLYLPGKVCLKTGCTTEFIISVVLYGLTAVMLFQSLTTDVKQKLLEPFDTFKFLSLKVRSRKINETQLEFLVKKSIVLSAVPLNVRIVFVQVH